MMEIRGKDKTLWDIWWDFTLTETVFSSIINIITNLRLQEFNIMQISFVVIIYGCI